MAEVKTTMLNTSRFDLGRLRAFRRLLETDRRMQEDVATGAKVLCVASG